jgi:predicted DNA-binding transcriptional regulator AlpA
MKFVDMESQLPVIIARKEVSKIFGLAISPKTLANHASLGTGPEQMKIGKTVAYATRNLLQWLDDRHK